MTLHRIMAIMRRHLLLTFRQPDRILKILYWTNLDLVIMGTMSIWIQRQSVNPSIITMILTGVILWQVVYIVNLETAKGLCEELLNHNVVNLFSTPLTLAEWIVAMMALGVIYMLFVFIFCTIAAWFLFSLNIFILGWTLIPFMFSLLIAGWSIGFFICGLLINWGLKAHDFVYSVGWLFVPFSAVYYPLDVLPQALQTIGKCLPMTYIFEAMRGVLSGEKLSTDYLFMSFGLNLFYLILTCTFFWYMFEKSKQKGLARLE